MLLPRVLTALFGIPVVLFLIHTGGQAYAAFVLTIIALSLYEYATLMKLGSKPVQAPTLYFFGLLIPAALYFDRYSAAQAGGNNFTGFVLALTVIGVMSYELFSPKKYLERIGLTLLGIFMISWCLFHLVAIRDIRPDGFAPTMILIITVRSWTRPPISSEILRRRQLSTISPKKTWRSRRRLYRRDNHRLGHKQADRRFRFSGFRRRAGRPDRRLRAGRYRGIHAQARRGSQGLSPAPATAGYSTASTPIFSWPP